MVALARPEDAGDLVGSGTGQIDGPQLRGKLRWSNFERSQPDQCLLTLIGEIDTEDGATIHFDSRGFALPLHTGTEWKIVSAVRFVVEDPRYQWLHVIRAVWTGEFDESSATARYRAFVARGAGGSPEKAGSERNMYGALAALLYTGRRPLHRSRRLVCCLGIRLQQWPLPYGVKWHRELQPGATRWSDGNVSRHSSAANGHFGLSGHAGRGTRWSRSTVLFRLSNKRRLSMLRTESASMRV